MIARLTRRAHRQLAAELDQALADAARHARTARERNTEALAQRARADRLEAQLHLAQQANESLTKELAQAPEHRPPAPRRGRRRTPRPPRLTHPSAVRPPLPPRGGRTDQPPGEPL
ncbi:hypothetical protein [Streptomyces sp. MJP52]|uniref:hypothetical protein n=1 Tax=Streptomyces sp. MJP52 TaxID=2940555 RepID=UPI002472E97E|nr:hypothetical protein [Streptomyces sp. MJP52]MDH6226246.1 exonuclease VII large subunit [Streptomyces sp. MJP52]